MPSSDQVFPIQFVEVITAYASHTLIDKRHLSLEIDVYFLSISLSKIKDANTDENYRVTSFHQPLSSTYK